MHLFDHEEETESPLAPSSAPPSPLFSEYFDPDDPPRILVGMQYTVPHVDQVRRAEIIFIFTFYFFWEWPTFTTKF